MRARSVVGVKKRRGYPSDDRRDPSLTIHPSLRPVELWQDDNEALQSRIGCCALGTGRRTLLRHTGRSPSFPQALRWLRGLPSSSRSECQRAGEGINSDDAPSSLRLSTVASTQVACEAFCFTV